jgi:hypothetical protein
MMASRRVLRRFALLVGMTSLAACAAGAPQPQPSDFPLHEHDQIFVLDYRIDRQPDRVDAVGLITSRTTTTFRFAELQLFGLTEDGRVLSRGVYRVDGTWGGPVSFTVTLTPTGQEARYKLQVGFYSIGLGS